MLDKIKLKSKIIERQKNVKEVADAIGITASTFYRKMAKNTFSIKEVDDISRALSLSKTEAMNIFFAPQGAYLHQVVHKKVFQKHEE